MISLTYSSAKPKTLTNLSLHFYNNALCTKNTPSALALAALLTLSMGLSGCQLTTTNTITSATEIKAHNEHLSTIYSDLGSALGSYFPLGYTQFAVISPQNISDSTGNLDYADNFKFDGDSISAQSDSNTTIGHILQPEQALARALIQQGANVCQTPQSCDLKAQKLTTTITNGPDYILVELFAPEITLQRLYNEQAQALGPISLYGNSSPIATNSTLLNANNIAPAASNKSTSAVLSNTTNSRRTATTAQKTLLNHNDSNTISKPITAPSPVISTASVENNKKTISQNKPLQETKSTAHDLNLEIAEKKSTKPAKSAESIKSAEIKNFAPINDHENTWNANSVSEQTTTQATKSQENSPKTTPDKIKKTQNLGPLQSAQNKIVDADNKDATLAKPDLKANSNTNPTAQISPSSTTNHSSIAKATPTSDLALISTNANVSDLANNGNSIDILTTIKGAEQANILTTPYNFTQHSPKTIFFSKTQSSRYRHRNSSYVLPLGMPW